ncbi:UNVERIFIED_CONTAM: hypothetical protein ABID98_001866 [Brevibacillus sp. OAP136]
MVGIQGRILITKREYVDICRFIKYSDAYRELIQKKVQNPVSISKIAMIYVTSKMVVGIFYFRRNYQEMNST